MQTLVIIFIYSFDAFNRPLTAKAPFVASAVGPPGQPAASGPRPLRGRGRGPAATGAGGYSELERMEGPAFRTAIQESSIFSHQLVDDDAPME